MMWRIAFSLSEKKNEKDSKKCVVQAIGLLVFSGVLCVEAIWGVFCYGESMLKKKTDSYLRANSGFTYDGKEYCYREDIINILCIGVDREESMMFDYGDGRSLGQADAIFLVSIDLSHDAIRVIAVPRDTMVWMKVYDNNGNYLCDAPGQITLQYAYADGGPMSCYLMTRQVADLLQGIPIQGCVAVNLSCISAINDAVGGVEVMLAEDYTAFNPKFKDGATIRLQGEEARDFIQKRDVNEQGSAYARIDREKQYLKAFIEQAKFAVKRNPMLPFSLLSQLQENMTMNIGQEEIFFLIQKALSCSYSEEEIYVLPGQIVQGDVYEEYYLDEKAVMEPPCTLFCREVAGGADMR